MPTFLLPHIRQCFATTSQTLIMHYAVNTVIIYVNTKLFKEMRGLKELVLRISSCEGVGRNCDGSCPAHTISGASPTFDNLTIHAIQWPSPETRGHRHSYKYDGSPTCSVCSKVCSVGECQCCREECGQESLARAGVSALPRRQSDIGHRTVNISRDPESVIVL